ncbi:MAG: molybdopterin-synthase adenylyltransferase MoeB, partial [Pseudomonadota bacterium]
GHPVRAMTGDNAAPWIVVGAIAGMFLVYRSILTRLREWIAERDGTAEETQVDERPSGTFSNVELERYSRHIVLREIGGAGQRSLKEARVLVIGAGGLGAPAILYLAAAGVGRIGVIDDDVVDHTNLQRQIIHADQRTGMPKVFSASEGAVALNPYVDVRPYNRRLTEETATALFEEYDVILDGTDNFNTRYLVNRVAHACGAPLISGALSQWEGQLSVFDPSRGTPCYQCIFAEPPASGLAPSCAEAGVLGPLPGVIGSMMAVEAVKLITGAGDPLRGQMLIYDALHSQTRTIALERRPDCQICGTGAVATGTATVSGS